MPHCVILPTLLVIHQERCRANQETNIEQTIRRGPPPFAKSITLIERMSICNKVTVSSIRVRCCRPCPSDPTEGRRSAASDRDVRSGSVSPLLRRQRHLCCVRDTPPPSDRIWTARCSVSR